MSQISKLLEIIESFRRKDHFYVDEDCFYSCPAHPDSCGHESDFCNCGFDNHNAEVDEALEIIRCIQQTIPTTGN